MAKSYLELLEEDFQRQIKYLNIKKYHDLGYKGKGITILNAESTSDHREMTTGVIKDYAPDATVLEGRISSRHPVIRWYCNVNFNDETLDIEKAIDKYNIKIITISQSGTTPNALLKYYQDIQKRKGVIFFNSAGNEGTYGVTGKWTKDDTAIAVGAVQLNADGTIGRMRYSAIGDELDFVSFMARGVGTSAASPALAAKVVLLLQRYGDFNQSECVEILKSLCFTGIEQTRARLGTSGIAINR